MPSIEGEEGYYLKNNFLAHAALLEAHHKQKEGTFISFHSAKFCLGLSNRKGNTTFCARLFSTIQLISKNVPLPIFTYIEISKKIHIFSVFFNPHSPSNTNAHVNQ